ncbi:MAG TPA: carboxypeptidase-like regulatory domain-containing protein [Bryobacteraceae bacterium]|nr:carboxypeptidase-like regulatory domain-containing protein [Bryobacteraceae bacterium]
MRNLALTLLVTALAATAGDTTTLTIHVTNQAGKPIGNASVIVRFVSGSVVKLNKARKEWELRTSEEGMAKMPPMPQGKILVQVIAKNYQTFGGNFDVEVDEKVIDVVLNPPQKQYSVHEAH